MVRIESVGDLVGWLATESVLYAVVDDKLPDNCVRVAAGHPATAGLEGMFGAVTLERMTAEKAA